jgi:hypothetical protein
VGTPSQSTAELIAAYLDAVIRKDASAVDHYFDPNVEYMVNGTPAPDPAGALPPISAECRAAFRGWVCTGGGSLPRTSWRICTATSRSPNSACATLFPKEAKQPRSDGSGSMRCRLARLDDLEVFAEGRHRTTP